MAMNIHDRPELYREIARVMKPGAMLCIYDVMRKNAAALDFPLPWAETEETSFLTTPDEMLVLLDGAGFDIDAVEDRTEIALEFFKINLAASKNGPPPLGVHLVLGAGASGKFKNMLSNIDAGRLSPASMTVTRR